MVLEARQLVDGDSKEKRGLDHSTTQSLDAFDYEDAALHVYGVSYGDWKSRHQKKATSEQMEKYEASQAIHAMHNSDLLKPRRAKPTIPREGLAVVSREKAPLVDVSPGTSLASNVCCQDPNDINASALADVAAAKVEQVSPPEHTAIATALDENETNKSRSRQLGPYVPPSPPSWQDFQQTCGKVLRIATITVSDRASRNEYSTGDLSGPAVISSIQEWWKTACSSLSGAPGAGSELLSTQSIFLQCLDPVIVPDESELIQLAIRNACNGAVERGETGDDQATSPPHLILTTGGTGFSPRDVTPEATRAVVDVECAGLMPFVTTECSRQQPLASLSRGTAGMIFSSKTMVANLPGNPKGISEIIPILAPLLFHAIVDLRR
jgi:molybdopterin biosynthesis enzyme MoaB